MNVHLKKKKRKTNTSDPLLWESCLSCSSLQAEVMVCIIYYLFTFFHRGLKRKAWPSSLQYKLLCKEER